MPIRQAFSAVLVFVIQEQGRYQEAEQLQRQVINIYQGLGYGVDSGPMVNAQVFLAQILNLQRRYDEASKLYDEIDVWTAKWEPSRREAISSGLARVSIMLPQGNYDNALEIAQRTFDRERGRSGDKSFNTAVARGYLAIALARKSKTAGSAAGLQGIDPGSADGLGRQRRRCRIDRRRPRSSRPLRDRRVFARAGAQSLDCSGAMSPKKPSAMRTCCAVRRFSGRCRLLRPARQPTSRNWPSWCARRRTAKSRSAQPLPH